MDELHIVDIYQCIKNDDVCPFMKDITIPTLKGGIHTLVVTCEKRLLNIKSDCPGGKPNVLKIEFKMLL